MVDKLTIYLPKVKIQLMATSDLDFESIRAEVQELYQSGNYVAALDLAERNRNRFQDQAALFTYWLICFNARLGRSDRSIGILRDALISGLWYGEVLLRKSPSLESLQAMPEFEDLIILNRQVQDADEIHHYPMLILRSEGQCSPEAPACPLLLGLHRNAGTVQSSLAFWRQAASKGWLVAALQSTQAVWKDSYVWDDLDASREEILHHVRTVIRSYHIDPHRIVIAGHSMGGEVAIWMALNGEIPAAGFIAFGPGGPLMDQPDHWLPFIEAAASRAVSDQALVNPTGGADSSLRGYLIYGTEDHTIQQQNIHILADALESAGLVCQVEAIPGTGHDFDPKFEAALLRGLEFISPRKSKN